jgi:putative membrane protein
MIGVTQEVSLNESMEKAVKHYSSLFTLPSYGKVLLFLAMLCVIGGLLSVILLFPSIDGLVTGLAFGFSLFFVDFLCDYVTSEGVLRQDPIYNLRRVSALSLFSWVLWFAFVFAGVALAVLLNDLYLWLKLGLLGFSAVLILRFIIFCTTSSLNFKRVLLASFAQPFLCVVPFLLVSPKIGYTIACNVPVFLVYSTVICFFSGRLFTFLLNRMGKKEAEISSLSLFKAFLLNWINDLNAPFEGFLEKLSKEQDVDISMIRFDASEPKAVMAVPSVHPGPFKNVGSSLLPSMLKGALEKKLGCVACVPHGLFGHELDLASQVQNQKIIKHVTAAANFEVSEGKASPFVEIDNGAATASCQIFGKNAFISFTLAPKTTEDLPEELGLFVREEAEKRGLECCIIVNSHNSIDGIVDPQWALDALKNVAVVCLERAVALKRAPFEVGAASVMPEGFSLKDGMGPGGISVVTVKVGEQKTAYVVIDGNNMVSGLREKIVSTIQSIGIDEGEVFTTDTHAVNAVVLSKRGYHPVGDAMDHKKLVGYIKRAAVESLSSLEHVNVGCRVVTVQAVKVIGEERLKTLCLLVEKTLQRAKRVVVPIFSAAGFLLVLALATL